MKNKLRNIFLHCGLLTIWLLTGNWGYIGHKHIALNAPKYYAKQLPISSEWTDTIVTHSSDADFRKKYDKTEIPKHYIDIDNYPEFIKTGQITQNYDSLIISHSKDYVIEQGTLPWATIAAYDSLVILLKRGNIHEAILIAADLSHYVADGHMPLHISANYDGQFSGNNGIHSRYETDMVNKYINEINIKGGNVSYIENVPDYIFSYIYISNKYVNTILHADDYAKKVNPDLTSEEYIAALWEKTAICTNFLFDDAAISFANLLYSAWIDADSPNLEIKH